MGFIIKRDDGKYLSISSGSEILDWTDDRDQAQKYDSLAQALPRKDACTRAGHIVRVIDLNQPKKIGDADWRAEAFLILDRKFHESPHLSTAVNPGGDYEVRCSRCGIVETFPRAGDRKGDAFTFALRMAGRHAHKE